MAKTTQRGKQEKKRAWKKKHSGETDWHSQKKAESHWGTAADRSTLPCLSSKTHPIPLPGVTASEMKATASGD